MHKNSILDLIIYLAKRIRLGETLNEIKQDALSEYNSAQISAAYSWILQRHPKVSDKKQPIIGESSHRILHFAERMLISPEAYGYLLEMVSIGLIDNKAMEHIIERVMFQSSEPIDLEKVKKLVENYVFDHDTMFKNHTSLLRGNETVN
ncbi:MAG: uncharacterized protein conserved in bacteria smg [Bacteroidetes bacterium HLUCCA01]|nr:MAG: uncharacterized protein conserved in bacteria smg [Bacteroidetes bacterium HLUCCA01]